MKKIMITVVAALSLSACGAHKPAPTQEQLASADYGSYPVNYKQKVADHMKMALFDPYSAQYDDWSNLVKTHYYTTDGIDFGYRGCVQINSKNRMGGYVGYKQFVFTIKNDKVISMDGGHRSGTVGDQNVLRACGKI